MAARFLAATAAACVVHLLHTMALTPAVEATTGVTRSTIINRRGADPTSVTSSMEITAFGELEGASPADGCTFDGGIISFSHPMSLKSTDKFFSTGHLQLSAIEMMIDEINTSPRCGVTVGGEKYGIHLTTFGDDSSKDKVAAIVQNGMMPLAESTEYVGSYWIGPYSSGLTGSMSPLANSTDDPTAAKTVLVAGGAASTSVFAGNPTIFGTFPPSKLYLAQAIEALARAGAKSAASVFESASFTKGVCAAMPELADMYNLTLQAEIEVISSPTTAELDPVARNLSMVENDPDIVVACVYDQGCAEWVASLRNSGWSPRAQVFTVCIGMDKFTDAVGTDAMYMMGVSPWDPSLDMQDEVVGWSAMEFSELFFDTTQRTSTYHAASAAASVGALVQAIERANSFDAEAVSNVLASQEFSTLYGLLSFDANGQSQAPSLHLQYDKDLEVQTVYPIEFRSAELVYPMPTWDARDCNMLSNCITLTGGEAGVCQEDGTCKCDSEDAISSGVGSSAKCVYIPNEDLTYVPTSLLVVGYILFGIQAFLSLACTVWTVHFCKRRVVKASQPLFLCLVAFGTFLMSLSIIPVGIQGEYLYYVDPLTGMQTDEPNTDIRSVNAACMALPWLFSMGFAVTFSALFAKIWRIKLVFQAARTFVRRQVGVKDVASIMVAVIVLQAIVLIAWNIADPLVWQREVLSSDDNGYPTKSIGTCSSNKGLAFLIPLTVIDALMLFYALYLCFITRKISDEYQEGTWITASVLSIIQILVLSIPILVIVENDNSASYFVRVAVIFLVSSTVTMLIFFPKIYRIHFCRDQAGRSRRTGFVANPGQLSSVETRDSMQRVSIESDRAKRFSAQSDNSVSAIAKRVAFQVDSQMTKNSDTKNESEIKTKATSQNSEV
eukprot:CAMPEP_0201718370 /NCGR_PEP_ID=MMETSP0593-20130828/3891_1 /ASSEMBLY_ACC=CAM_ASM_000672 /TAXON_ID=267983 /ORGANISM="Skeletonema japonicum, Strain CCMP2506" /LENGTH=894 /DNA_ID=CAMNT_0048208651 /DNA_START=50 /DNA_END=2734 /DNA_ORIENTATION=-